jgi:hypothetical protein
MPNPWMIIGAIVVCIAAYFSGHRAGYAQRDQEMQAQIALKNEQARQAENKLNEQINQTSTELKEANDAIAKKQSDLNRLISVGRVRLPATSCIQASTSTPAATASSQDGADSDRQTLLLIAQLVAEGDQAIARLNACISAYEQVRATVNGQQ